MLRTAHFILYVKSQQESTVFYSRVLSVEPQLDVPGMTEFGLPGGAVLGLMPVDGIARLLGDAVPDIARQPRVPRAELYIVVDSADAYMARAGEAGARELSPVIERDWGHMAGYCEDPDGHVLAFANALPSVER